MLFGMLEHGVFHNERILYHWAIGAIANYFFLVLLQKTVNQLLKLHGKQMGGALIVQGYMRWGLSRLNK